MTPWVPCTLVWAHSATTVFDALESRDPRLAERLHTALGRYALTGRGDVQALAGMPAYRLRVGDGRVIFDLDTTRNEIEVLWLAHRRDVYRRWETARQQSHRPLESGRR